MITDEKALVFIKERLYDRRNELLENINLLTDTYREVYNAHDFQSGFYRGSVDNMKKEVDFLENLINNIEQVA